MKITGRRFNKYNSREGWARPKGYAKKLSSRQARRKFNRKDAE